jgi:hypothetical protein
MENETDVLLCVNVGYCKIQYFFLYKVHPSSQSNVFLVAFIEKYLITQLSQRENDANSLV